MRHPRLRALRLSLVAALAATGCQQDPEPVLDPAAPDAAPPDAAPDDPACLDPEPILDPAGDPTGVQRCADGSLRRFASVACQPLIDDGACPAADVGGCDADADCTDGPHGRCVDAPWGRGAEPCICRYGCASDADCGAGEICLCPGVVDGSSHCVPAGCTTGADCASGACLVNSTSDSCMEYPEVACLDPGRDECRSHADCGGDGRPGPNCIRSDDLWTCQQTPICGRPLTIAGFARAASTTARDDWATAAPPALAARPAGITGLRAALLDAIA